MSNQLRADPEKRLEDYLKQCVDQHYKERQPDQRFKDLGVTDDMVVISDSGSGLADQVLARIEAKSGQ